METVLVYSDALLEKINGIAKLHSSFYRKIQQVQHNHFEIRVVLEPFTESDPAQLETMQGTTIHRLFLQWMTLYMLTKAYDWDFIDFSRFTLPGGKYPAITFPVMLTAESMAETPDMERDIQNLIRIFSRNPHLDHLNETNIEQVFQQLVTRYTFDENWFYIYRYNDFTSSFLNTIPDLEYGGNVRINIQTAGKVQRGIARDAIIACHQSESVYLENTAAQSITQQIVRLVSQDCGPQKDYAAVVDALDRFFQQSSYSTMMLLVEQLDNKDDADFLNFLMEASDSCNIVLICFDAHEGLMDFDLQLKDNPINLAAQHLHMGTPKPRPAVAASAQPEISNLDKIYTIIETLETGTFAETPELMELMIALMLEGIRHNTTEKAIRALAVPAAVDRQNSAVAIGLKLIIAYICRLQRDHPGLRRIMDELAEDTRGKIPEPLSDQFYYLQIARNNSLSDLRNQYRRLKKIKSELYRHRAMLYSCDNDIYKGNLSQSEKSLKKAAEFFNSNKFYRDEYEARSLQAKLAREKGDFKEAEKIYKNIFVNCEMKNYRLFAAYMAIDLGTLYLNQDRFSPTETWYKRGLKIFQAMGNQAGIRFAQYNLMDIHKVYGNWLEVKHHLQTALEYDIQNSTENSMGVDYYNMAHLEYRKRNFSVAHQLADKAIALFEKNESFTFVISCQLLKLQIALVSGEKEIDTTTLKKNCIQLNPVERAACSILETACSSNHKGKVAGIRQKISLLKLKSIQYDMLSTVIYRYKKPDMLKQLKELSIVLSTGTKNYYYYEYYYIYFELFHGDQVLDEEQQKSFNDCYYFFLGNGRKLSTAIHNLRQKWEECQSSYEIFSSARLVDDYQHWKIPADFFKSLTQSITQHRLSAESAAVQLIRLNIYTPYKTEPLFDFTENFSSAANFSQLTTEIMAHARSVPDHLNLGNEEIRQRFLSNERVFYPFGNTQVILWRLSAKLSAVLLLAFSTEEYRNYDFLQRHSSLLEKFASLITRYYEKDYHMDQTLSFIIGSSQSIKKVKREILLASKVDFPVVILGESGTGKELVAKGVHLLSSRCNQAFVPVNAAAIPENLLEAELFGYKRGAFTGANEDKIGLIESAHKGTLFLDEIADLPLNMQAKLLRVFQEQEVRRLGEVKTRAVDVRLVSATNKDLEKLIAENQFREDLFYRLQDLEIKLPPLRERKEDIPLLINHFLELHSSKQPDPDQLQQIYNLFQQGRWQGNIRELKSAVRRLIAHAMSEPEGFDTVLRSGLPVHREMALAKRPIPGLIEAREDFERQMIYNTLKELNGHKADTAEALEISRQHLFKLMTKYDIRLI